MHIFFPCPPPLRANHGIYPIFLPFLGCPGRCVFCAQDRQSGTPPHTPDSLDALLTRATHDLAARAPGKPMELGFYGGTFTLLPHWALQRCLRFLAGALDRGLAHAARCSTRPDALPPPLLAHLAQNGLAMVEVGVQSFADTALSSSRRGHDSATARAGCTAVRAAGLKLGVQLMPGMPGTHPQTFVDDVRTALELGADCLRFYPCLVLEGTELARMWRAGAYTPWPLDATLEALAAGLTLAQAAGVPVIRMGLAPQTGLEGAILAGPTHPALGSAVQGLALLARVRARLDAAQATPPAGRPFALELPAHCQGHFWGHGKNLARHWRALGLTHVRFTHRADGRITLHARAKG